MARSRRNRRRNSVVLIMNGAPSCRRSVAFAAVSKPRVLGHGHGRSGADPKRRLGMRSSRVSVALTSADSVLVIWDHHSPVKSLPE